VDQVGTWESRLRIDTVAPQTFQLLWDEDEVGTPSQYVVQFRESNTLTFEDANQVCVWESCVVFG